MTSHPFGISAESPIQSETPTGSIYGTLTAPVGQPKPVVALIIAGSGATDRNGNGQTAAVTNNCLKLLAAALAGAGFASVRYDKRGVGSSRDAAPSERELRIEHYVQDAGAWVECLARDSRFSGVVVIGHSQGSLIGMLAAQRCPVLAFVSVAGPAENAAAVLRRQLAGQLPSDLAATSDAILASLEAGRLSDDVPLELLPLYRPSVQPYLVSWFQYTPRIELARLRIPCLILQGDTDIQVGVSDAHALHGAHGACQLALVPGMNHVLKMVPPDRAEQLASYGNPDLPIAEGLVQALTQFLRAITAAARSDPDAKATQILGSSQGAV